MKRILVATTLLTTIFTANAQAKLELATIRDIVKNEKDYYHDIVDIYKSDDPYLRTDDIALVYYGEAFKENDKESENDNKLLKKYYHEGNFNELYTVATKILAHKPANLNALFYAWAAAKENGKNEEETLSYVNKFNRIIQMITEYGNGKNSKSPFRIVHPDDQLFVMAALGIEESISNKFDTETLCNIHIIRPTEKFKSSIVYFDLSLFLKQKSKE